MSANAFLQGFTGGVNAINSLIDARQKREYRQQQMAQAERLMGMKEEEFVLKKKEAENLSFQRNGLFINHLYKKVMATGDKKKIYEFKNKLFQNFNNIPAVKNSLPEGYSIGGLEPVGDGFLPILKHTDENGQEVRSPLTMNGHPVTISQSDIYSHIPSEMVSEMDKVQARLLGTGYDLPEEKDKFKSYYENGMLINENLTTNEKTVAGYKKSGLKETVELENGNTIERFSHGGRIYQREIFPDGREKKLIDITDTYLKNINQNDNVNNRFEKLFYDKQQENGTETDKPKTDENKNEETESEKKPKHYKPGEYNPEKAKAAAEQSKKEAKEFFRSIPEQTIKKISGWLEGEANNRDKIIGDIKSGVSGSLNNINKRLENKTNNRDKIIGDIKSGVSGSLRDFKNLGIYSKFYPSKIMQDDKDVMSAYRAFKKKYKRPPNEKEFIELLDSFKPVAQGMKEKSLDSKDVVGPWSQGSIKKYMTSQTGMKKNKPLTVDEIYNEALKIAKETRSKEKVEQFLKQFPEDTIRKITSRLAPQT